MSFQSHKLHKLQRRRWDEGCVSRTSAICMFFRSRGDFFHTRSWLSLRKYEKSQAQLVTHLFGKHICEWSDVMCLWMTKPHSSSIAFLWCIQFSHSTFGKGRRNFVFSRLESKIIPLWFSSVRCSRLFFGWQLIKGSQLISVSLQKWTKLTSTSRLQS